MTPGLIIGVVLTVAAVAWIGALFVRDHRIRSRGRRIRVHLDEARRVGTSDTGAVTIRYRASWAEDGETRHVEGRETVSARHAALLVEGTETDIIYLDDDRVMLAFD